jgi:putative ABC transport system permease protein
VREHVALAGVGVRRVVGRIKSGDGARVAISIAGVAAAVALALAATGIGVGLATETTVAGAGVDYWVVPESASASSLAVSVGGAQFGGVHGVSAELNDDPRIEYATPVSTQVMRVGGDGGEYVLVVGAVPREGMAVAGLPADPLTPGDPHYANGTYNGTYTGDLVLSEAWAQLLNSSGGERLRVAVPGGGPGRTFETTAVREGGVDTGAGGVPVALVHLAELQTLTGGADGDTADQLLVATNDPGVRETLTDLYPRSNVVSAGGLSAGGLADSTLALAVALAAALVALVVGALFVATTMGMELAADRPQFATLAAIGLSRRARGTVVVAQTMTVTLAGGLLGILLGRLAVAATNRAAESLVGAGNVAAFPLPLAGYGLAVAVVIGALAAPYLLWLSDRSDPLEHL